jgi:hypothetical protein
MPRHRQPPGGHSQGGAPAFIEAILGCLRGHDTAHSCKLSDYFSPNLLARKKPLAINVARAGEGIEAAEVCCKQIVDHQV